MDGLEYESFVWYRRIKYSKVLLDLVSLGTHEVIGDWCCVEPSLWLICVVFEGIPWRFMLPQRVMGVSSTGSAGLRQHYKASDIWIIEMNIPIWPFAQYSASLNLQLLRPFVTLLSRPSRFST